MDHNGEVVNHAQKKTGLCIRIFFCSEARCRASCMSQQSAGVGQLMRAAPVWLHSAFQAEERALARSQGLRKRLYDYKQTLQQMGLERSEHLKKLSDKTALEKTKVLSMNRPALKKKRFQQGPGCRTTSMRVPDILRPPTPPCTQHDTAHVSIAQGREPGAQSGHLPCEFFRLV